MLQSPRRRPVRRALGSLFREARRLERRRRRRYAAGILLACAIAGGGGLLLASAGGSSDSGEHRASSLVSSLLLPRAGDFFSLGVVGDRVIVSGGPAGSLFPSGSTTSLSGGRAAGSCDGATVEPGALRLGPVIHANCGDPALYGEQVLAVSYLAQLVSRARGGLGEFAVRVAHVDPDARDGYTLGPVVMTYPECSDCSAQWIYGDGSLWLYGPYAGGGLSRPQSELLRVSDATGAVVQRWAIPPNSRELLAVDTDGLWFAPSVEGGFPEHTPGAQLIRYESLYRVTPGANTAVRVFKIPFGNAFWLVAAGHTVWLESHGVHGRSELWRLQGPNARPTFHGTYPADTDQGADIGEAPPTHAGNAAIGIYYVNDPGPSSPPDTPQQIIHLSPGAATQRTVATVPAPPDLGSYGIGPPGVALGGSFYFLDPPLLNYRSGDRPPMVDGQGVLYQVQPQQARPAK